MNNLCVAVTACAVHRITCEALKGPAPVYPNKPVIPQAYIITLRVSQNR
jgi:hypothetical protein